MSTSASQASGECTFSPSMSEAYAYMAWVLSAFDGFISGSVLEIGLGHGSYYPQLKALGSSYVGVEIDGSLVERAKKKYPEALFLNEDATSSNFANSFDTVICFNVLEHLRDDRLAVEGFLHALVPTGHLCLFVPAFPVLYGDMDRLAGHFRRYTLDSLSEVVAGAGGELVEARYFNSLGGFGWLINRLISHRSLASNSVNRQIAFFDRYLVPFARGIDVLFSSIFGQSIVCVVRLKSEVKTDAQK